MSSCWAKAVLSRPPVDRAATDVVSNMVNVAEQASVLRFFMIFKTSGIRVGLHQVRMYRF